MYRGVATEMLGEGIKVGRPNQENEQRNPEGNGEEAIFGFEIIRTVSCYLSVVFSGYHFNY